jgi:hypothetical protein
MLRKSHSLNQTRTSSSLRTGDWKQETLDGIATSHKLRPKSCKVHFFYLATLISQITEALSESNLPSANLSNKGSIGILVLLSQTCSSPLLPCADICQEFPYWRRRQTSDGVICQSIRSTRKRPRSSSHCLPLTSVQLDPYICLIERGLGFRVTTLLKGLSLRCTATCSLNLNVFS